MFARLTPHPARGFRSEAPYQRPAATAGDQRVAGDGWQSLGPIIWYDIGADADKAAVADNGDGAQERRATAKSHEATAAR